MHQDSGSSRAKRRRRKASETASQTDGRVVRGQRVRESIVRAMLELFEDGNLRPTTAEIAARADVSLRALFNHFKDNDALIAAAFKLQAEREARFEPIPIPPDRPLDEKIAAFAHERAAALEKMTPYRRAANAFEPFSREVSEGLHRARERTRKQIDQVFEPELAALPAPQRREVLAMLVVACSWPSWDTLRTTMHLNPAQGCAVTTDLLHRILDPLGKQSR